MAIHDLSLVSPIYMDRPVHGFMYKEKPDFMDGWYLFSFKIIGFDVVVLLNAQMWCRSTLSYCSKQWNNFVFAH